MKALLFLILYPLAGAVRTEFELGNYILFKLKKKKTKKKLRKKAINLHKFTENSTISFSRFYHSIDTF